MRICQTVTYGRLNTVKVWAVWQIFCILLALFIQQFIKLRLQTKLSGKLSTSSRWHSENIQSHYQCISFVHHVIDSLHHPPARLWSSSEAWVQWFQWQWIIPSSLYLPMDGFSENCAGITDVHLLSQLLRTLSAQELDNNYIYNLLQSPNPYN